MLMRSFGRLLGAFAAAILVAAVVLVASSAAQAKQVCTTQFDPNTNSSQTVCHDDGTGTPGSGGGDNDTGLPASFTPGPTTCTASDGTTVPCTKDGGWWNESCQGWVSIADPQPAAPAGESSQVGAWYTCTPYCTSDTAVGGNPLDPGSGFCVGTPFWSNTPPPGINRYTPAQAAAVVISRMTEAPIGIGMAPAQKVHSDDPAGTAPYRRTWVGIPVWLWVDNPTAQTWGPQSITATVGGVTISATASVNQVVWDAGDGQSVTCGQGTVFVESEWANQAAQDSPTCGFRYQHTGTYTVTATSSWTVSWTGGGDSGTQTAIAKATSSPVTVGQLESVNAPLTQSDIEWGMTH